MSLNNRVTEADKAVVSLERAVKTAPPALNGLFPAESKLIESALADFEDGAPGELSELILRLRTLQTTWDAFSRAVSQTREVLADIRGASANADRHRTTNPPNDARFRTFALAIRVLWPHAERDPLSASLLFSLATARGIDDRKARTEHTWETHAAKARTLSEKYAPLFTSSSSPPAQNVPPEVRVLRMTMRAVAGRHSIPFQDAAEFVKHLPEMLAPGWTVKADFRGFESE